MEPLFVLNPGGRDPDQDFADFAGDPGGKGHPPVNYHGYAACTGGAFLRSAQAVRSRGGKNVLLLLRSDLQESLAVLHRLKMDGCRVWISFKESGLHQIAQTLRKSGQAPLLHQLGLAADGAIASTTDAVAIYRSAGAAKVEFIPAPYPVDDSRWDFSVPLAQRSGIFVGTREFDVPTRNHLAAVLLALQLSAEHDEPVTVVNLDGRKGRNRLQELKEAVPGSVLQIAEGRRNYSDYLRLLARHKIVFQLDASSVPGQVAGDALLCRVPCLGGNGATDRLVFPGLTSHGRDLEQMATLAAKILTNSDAGRPYMDEALELARRHLDFPAIRRQLNRMLSAS